MTEHTKKASDSKKVFVMTWGCQMNEYDSSRLYDLMQSDCHMEKAANADEADVILLNTCSIREKPQEKVFSELGRLEKLRRKKPNLRIGVGGCVGAQEGDNILKRAANVNFVFGPQTIHKVPHLLQQSEQEGIKITDVTFELNEKFDNLPKPQLNSTNAYLSIMEGCDKFCTFCIVPFTRGAEVNRLATDILEEAEHLLAQGATEIMLLGQNVNAWSGLGQNFAWLLRRLAEFPTLKRLRYTTAHPIDMTDDIIQAHADLPILGSHIHLPIQSGSNKVLANMKRLYTREMIIELIAKLRKARPGMTITTDFIVGFPSESEADFADTIALAEEIGFDNSYSFVYSARPGTMAETMQDLVDPDTAKARLAVLQSTLAKSALTIRSAMLGTTADCLISGFSKRAANQLVGYTDNDQTVHLDNADTTYLNKITPVKITALSSHGLRGEVL